jgi:Protein of unknown function (DUF433)
MLRWAFQPVLPAPRIVSALEGVYCVRDRDSLPLKGLRGSLTSLLSISAEALTPSQILNYSADVDYSKIITIEPGKRSGKPCIRGMRITVQDVFEYLAGV